MIRYDTKRLLKLLMQLQGLTRKYIIQLRWVQAFSQLAPIFSAQFRFFLKVVKWYLVEYLP